MFFHLQNIQTNQFFWTLTILRIINIFGVFHNVQQFEKLGSRSLIETQSDAKPTLFWSTGQELIKFEMNVSLCRKSRTHSQKSIISPRLSFGVWGAWERVGGQSSAMNQEKELPWIKVWTTSRKALPMDRLIFWCLPYILRWFLGEPFFVSWYVDGLRSLADMRMSY